MWKRLVVIFLSLQVSGCSSWWGEENVERVPGSRISVMADTSEIRLDTRKKAVKIILPKPFINEEWPQAGGFSDHAMHHLSAPGELREVWNRKIGSGSSREKQLIAPPILSQGVVYTLSSDADLLALDQFTGKRLWASKLMPLAEEKVDSTAGGGLAVTTDFLLATTGFGAVFCLDLRNGKVLWRKDLRTPIRSGPTIADNKAIILSITNETYALNIKDGKLLWKHSGSLETAILFGSSIPAASGSTVVVSHSSGELVALNIKNGKEIWSDALVSVRRNDPMSSIPHIRGFPVIDRGLVIATSNSGRTVTVDLKTGNRIWERNFGSAQTPWVAGDFIYLVTNDSQLVCLSRLDGSVHWVTKLGLVEDAKSKIKPIYWTGPVLAGDRLLVAGSSSEVWSISPYSGKILGMLKLSDRLFIAPVVANKLVYLISDDGKLFALR